MYKTGMLRECEKVAGIDRTSGFFLIFLKRSSLAVPLPVITGAGGAPPSGSPSTWYINEPAQARARKTALPFRCRCKNPGHPGMIGLARKSDYIIRWIQHVFRNSHDCC